MFTCDQLLQIMNTTPSKKTKLAFVDILVPRITNPKDSGKILNEFPYANEKSQVKELLAARAKQIQRDVSVLSPPKPDNGVEGGRGSRGGRHGGRGGRGGRGGGRGGRGATASTPPTPKSAPPKITIADPFQPAETEPKSSDVASTEPSSVVQPNRIAADSSSTSNQEEAERSDSHVEMESSSKERSNTPSSSTKSELTWVGVDHAPGGDMNEHSKELNSAASSNLSWAATDMREHRANSLTATEGDAADSTGGTTTKPILSWKKRDAAWAGGSVIGAPKTQLDNLEDKAKKEREVAAAEAESLKIQVEMDAIRARQAEEHERLQQARAAEAKAREAASVAQVVEGNLARAEAARAKVANEEAKTAAIAEKAKMISHWDTKVREESKSGMTKTDELAAAAVSAGSSISAIEFIRKEHEKLQSDAQKRMQAELDEIERHEASVAEAAEIAKNDMDHRADLDASGRIWGTPDPNIVTARNPKIRKSPTKAKDDSAPEAEDLMSSPNASYTAAEEIAFGGRSVLSLVSKFGTTSLKGVAKGEGTNRPPARRPTMALNLKAPNSGGSDGDLAGKAFLDPVENRLTLSEIQEQLKSKAFGDYNPAKLEVSSGIDMHTIMHFPAEKIAYNVLVEAHSTPILSNQIQTRINMKVILIRFRLREDRGAI